jgi:hypothetical protein
MGTINHRKKHIALKIKHRKKEKVRRLIAKAQTADSRERDAILKKIQRIAPYPVTAETLAARK